jgi:hypothetical protein
VDIVVGGTSTDELASVLAPFVDRRTRFGGLQLAVEGTAIDIWPLQDTWAFGRSGMPPASFAALPRTTFLNAEAVVLELCDDLGRTGQLHAFGFWESVLSHTLEINFEENPSPALCIVRSLCLADRLGYDIGPRLGRYITTHLSRLSVEELVSLQLKEGGRVRCTREWFQAWKENFAFRVRQSREVEPYHPKCA